MVPVALVREYTYAYATVTPKDGSLDWMVAPKMDTITMSAFLDHVSRRHPDDFVVMVLDGAPSHRSQDLRVPKNMAIVRLPPYSPELNPAERLWDDIREKEFANRIFDSLGAAIGNFQTREKKSGLRGSAKWPGTVKISSESVEKGQMAEFRYSRPAKNHTVAERKKK